MASDNVSPVNITKDSTLDTPVSTKVFEINRKKKKKKNELTYLQENKSRQVTFCKRRKNIFKKAKELNILTKADMLVIAVSNDTEALHMFATPAMQRILNDEKLFQKMMTTALPERLLAPQEDTDDALYEGGKRKRKGKKRSKMDEDDSSPSSSEQMGNISENNQEDVDYEDEDEEDDEEDTNQYDNDDDEDTDKSSSDSEMPASASTPIKAKTSIQTRTKKKE